MAGHRGQVGMECHCLSGAERGGGAHRAAVRAPASVCGVGKLTRLLLRVSFPALRRSTTTLALPWSYSWEVAALCPLLFAHTP